MNGNSPTMKSSWITSYASSCRLLAQVLVVSTILARSATGSATDPLQPSQPRFLIPLSYAEFSILHEAAKGGSPDDPRDLQVRLLDGADGPIWLVELADAALLESIDRSLTGSISPPASPERLDLVTATRTRVREARRSPVFDLTTAHGVLGRSEHGWFVEGPERRTHLDWNAAGPAHALLGRPVSATGIVRSAGMLDVLGVFEARPKTLDLFVMSLCPFARAAEATILSRLQDGADAVLRVHYIFIPEHASASASLTSMHGEPEVHENLVQMSIRDAHPARFPAYLRLRASSDSSWEVIAREAGLADGEIGDIARRIAAERDALIRREYDFVAGVCGVRDGSPTFVWEGRHVDATGDVALLRDWASGAGSCRQEAAASPAAIARPGD